MLNKVSRSSQKGVILLETLIAILIFSIGVLAVMGLQSISIRDGMHAKYRTDASYLANQVVAQMMIDKTGVGNYADGGGGASRTAWDAEVADRLPNGTGSVVMAGSQVTVTVRWQLPNESDTHSYFAIAQVVY